MTLMSLFSSTHWSRRIVSRLSFIAVCSFNNIFVICFYFFFSSRRRHTISDRDWSSDVCSSDLNLLINAEAALRDGLTQRVRGMVAGAAPPAAMIEGMARIGFELTHAYGLTETYGPAAVAAKRGQWAAASLAEQTRLNGRQGVRYVLQEGMTVLDPETMTEVAPDAQTLGEIMFRGNIVMKGYLKNPAATAEAFAGGWVHTGDLAVLEPDRYVKIKDRSKDVIISGGENISSLEVEDALYRHPAVMTCAVVARPDPKWGETPLAFVELKSGVTVSA